MTTISDPARELVVSRVFRAPRDLVYRMWMEPGSITNWWGPHGFSTTTHEMDFRPGGTWRFTMRGPDGREYPNRVHYLETSPNRLEYEHYGDGNAVAFHVVVALREVEPNQTEMEFRMIFSSTEERRRVVEEYGADQGLRDTVSRLDVVLCEEQSASDPFHLHLALPSDKEILMTRAFRAPRALVFEAFTKPEILQRWWAPYGYAIPSYESEPRVGGKWAALCKDPAGNAFAFRGEYLEIEPPERVVQTFECDVMAGAVSVNEATFEERQGVAYLRILAKFESQEDRDAMLRSGMEWGAGQGYERLEALLGAAGSSPRFEISREFDVPRELVWKAWSEAERLNDWWGPKGGKIETAKLDFRPGGMFHYSMETPQGKMWGRFIYREIAPPGLLAFANAFSDETGGVTRAPFSADWPLEVLNVLTLEERAGRTLLKLQGTPLTANEAELSRFAAAFDSLRQGFGGALDQLEAHLRRQSS